MSDHHFNNPTELDRALAEELANRLSEAVARRGNASLVVSGGSTPKGLFALLSEEDLPWSKIVVLLADERWVAADHDDSNERMVKELLLQKRAKGAQFISLIPAFPNEESNLAAVAEQLAALETFDVVILGMGGDMHTASLFPCSAEVAAGLSTEAPVLMTHPKTAPHARISLSRQRLENTRFGLIHIVGEDKLQVMEGARETLEQDEHAGSRAPIGIFAEPVGQFEVWYSPKL